MPLAPQAVAVLREFEPLTGGARRVFPGARTHGEPMSENTIDAALRRVGYDRSTLTAHGFRGMASTMDEASRSGTTPKSCGLPADPLDVVTPTDRADHCRAKQTPALPRRINGPSDDYAADLFAGDRSAGTIRGRAPVADRVGSGVQAGIGFTTWLTDLSQDAGRLDAAGAVPLPGSGSLVCTVKQQSSEPLPLIDPQLMADPGFTVALPVSDASRLEASIVTPAPTVAPGEVLALQNNAPAPPSRSACSAAMARRRRPTSATLRGCRWRCRRAASGWPTRRWPGWR